MTHLTEPVLLAFRTELRKIAGISPTMGAGLTLGAIGAIGGGAKKYLEARDRGEGVGGALAEGAGGAALGGALGGAAGAGLGVFHPGAAGAVSRFGQRQFHGLTGWKPEGGLATIRGGAFDAKQRLDTAHAMHQTATAAHAAGPTAETATALGKAEKELRNATAGHAAAEKAETMGLTSLPGYVQSVKKHGLFPSMKASADEQLHGTTLGQKALVLGLPAAGLAHAAMSQPGVDDEGLSKGERVGKQVGELVGGVAGGAIPVVGQTIFQEGAGRIGKLIGGGVDRFRRAPATNPTDPLLSSGQTTPSEIVTSPRVSGGIE